MGWNHIRVCECAFSREEVKEYFEGIGKYTEPPNQYLDEPPTDRISRNNCINILYERDRDEKYISRYKQALLELSKGRVDQLRIAMECIMIQLQLEQKRAASFQLNDKSFYDELRKTIQSKENEIKNTKVNHLGDMWEVLKIQDEYISSKTGYHILGAENGA